MSDLISRHAAIDAVEHITSSMSVCMNLDECHGMKKMQRQAVIELTNLQSANEESFEWCTDCKEYDQEKHCCYRWTKVIRETVEEIKQAQPEHRTLTEDDYVYCAECDHVEMCRWYPMYGCEFKGRSSVQQEPITLNIDHELTQDECEKLRKDISNAPIMLLPSAQWWTPCSERPPKKTGYYICTCHDGVCYRVSVLKWSTGWVLTGARSYWKVIAWMPLPEPYKGEES